MLVTVSEAMESLGMAPVLESQLEAPLLKAISKAQLRLEAELDSKLDKLESVENFHVDSDLNSGTLTHGMLCLRLSCGFVDPAVTIAVEVSDVWKGPFEAVANTEYQLNRIRGLLYLDEAYDGKFVKVTYTSGFKTSKETPVSVKQALLSILPSTLAIQGEGDDEKSTPKSGVLFGGVLVMPLKRPTPIGFRPYLVDSSPVA